MRLVWRPLLAWPGELTPNNKRGPGQWSVTEKRLFADLEREVAWLECDSEVVFEVATAGGEDDFTLSGGLRASAKLSHPGVVVSFESPKVGPLRLACDRYWHPGGAHSYGRPDVYQNVRAVSLTLERLRAVERYGVATGFQQYQGWKAIGPGSIELGPHRMSEMEARQLFRAVVGDFARTDDVSELFRLAAKVHHPDAGGDEATFKLLVEARDVLLGVKS